MKIIKTVFDGVFLLEPKIYSDQRGFFYEYHNAGLFKKVTGLDIRFVQDNLAKSAKNVLRGMHFQKSPYEQAKLVSVIQGDILDVVVDLRKNSPTFLQYFSVRLNDQNRYQLFIPKGFAHGYLSLADDTYVFYKTDAFYNPAADTGFRFNDPDVQINWPLAEDKMILSEKDKNLPYLKEIFREN